MSWNHRVIYHPKSRDNPEAYYGVHEVYYDEQGGVRNWTADAEVIGESMTGLAETLMLMRRAVAATPVLVETKRRGAQVLVTRP